MAYDQTLPPEEQCRYTPDIADLLQICIPVCDTYDSSESQRTIASEGVKRLDEQATHLIRRIHQLIKSDLYDTPEQAEAWGFQVKQSTKTVLLPKTRKERLVMLKKYIAQEESRPAEERFTKPDLETVKQVRDGLVTHLAVRRSGRDKRKSSRAARDEAFAKLVDCLRMAAGDLIIKRFDHKISFEMQQWGFEIVDRPSARPERSEVQPAEPAPVEAAAPEPAATEPAEPETSPNGSSPLNGAGEAVVELNGQASAAS
ncbi:MAG: hypothetical protein H6632_16600 [Anaerolineales bacterium]|nr:hypothetical protein [Anaerolineales bacterium]